MDHATRRLVEKMDEQIRRSEMLVEQHRLSIADLNPAQRRAEAKGLQECLKSLQRLLRSRQALLTKIGAGVH